MSGDHPVYLAIAGSVLAGAVWGRLSSRLPVPEWLRLLSIFVWTGLLGVLVMVIVGVLMHSWTAPAVVEAAALGPFALVRLALGEACLFFLLGAMFGFPATLGWVVAYRQPAKAVATSSKGTLVNNESRFRTTASAAQQAVQAVEADGRASS
jgi:phosphoglycerol transferase MdoB-like AlkP superfamily enzyme